MHDPKETHEVKLPVDEPTTVSMQCVPNVGMAPVRSLTPREHFAFGLLDVVMELAGMLWASGIITPQQTQEIMERRAGINAAAYGDFAAMAAKSLANVARLEGMPKARAFPKEASVVPFPSPKSAVPESREEETT